VTGAPLAIAMIGLRGIPASYGGVERAVEDLSVRLVARGHDVTVYGRKGYCDTSIREYRGVSLRYLPAIETKHLEAATHTLVSVSDALRRSFDVIHLHATGPGMFSVIPRVARVPTVVTVHGLDWQREKWGPAATAVLRLASRVSVTVPSETVVVSRTLQRAFREAMGATTTYIPNGIDTTELRDTSPVQGLEPGRFVLFLGRLVPEKGVHTLIEAFSRVESPVRLAVAGPPSHSERYARELEELARRDGRVLMLGARYGAEKAWLLNNALAFVQPSTLEGLPLTLMEAVACGAFPIVSDISENVEVVTVGERTFGSVFRAGDPDDLAAKLKCAVDEPPHPQPADVAGTLAERYDLDRIAGKTEAVYERVARGGRA
jgi:glycosyltransferase involved in cell wall biosynthesis